MLLKLEIQLSDRLFFQEDVQFCAPSQHCDPHNQNKESDPAAQIVCMHKRAVVAARLHPAYYKFNCVQRTP